MHNLLIVSYEFVLYKPEKKIIADGCFNYLPVQIFIYDVEELANLIFLSCRYFGGAPSMRKKKSTSRAMSFIKELASLE